MADYRLFWREFRRSFQSTGAVLPSGPALCRALARHTCSNGAPRRLLEVGPGTGVVTEQIVARMGSGDTLELVELNERFVNVLEKRRDNDPSWQALADRIQIHQQPIEQFTAEQPFDAIVSGLPLNNFPAELVHRIVSHLASLAAADATFSFFEYVGVRKAKAIVSSKTERRRLVGIENTLAAGSRKWRFDRDLVVANVPPAWVHHWRFDDGNV